MIKLTYTEEMKEQDKLWETESEDLSKMEILYNKIIEQAKERGFKGRCEIVDFGGEMTCDVYEKEDDEESYALVGFCKPLIEKLEEILN